MSDSIGEIQMNKTKSTGAVTFQSQDETNIGPTFTVTGIPADFLKQGDKILKIMDILELPKGTNARLVYEASDVIVR